MINSLVNFVALTEAQTINWTEVIMVFATTLSACGTIALAIFGYKALNPWEKELRYKHKAEFIAQAKLLLICLDNFYGNGKINDKLRNLSVIKRPYWQPFLKNDVDRYTKEAEQLYKNLLIQEAYIDGLRIRAKTKICNDFLKTINRYKEKLSNIATAKLNFCHEVDAIRDAAFKIFEENSIQIVKIKKKAHKLYKKVKNI